MLMKGLTIILFSILCLNVSGQEFQNMTLLGNWDDNSLPSNNFADFQYNDIWGYTDAQGREYAILGNETWVIFLDVTNPLNPIEKDRVAPGGTSLWRDFKTYGNYAYGTMEHGEGLVIFNLTDIANGHVTFTSNQNHFTSAHNLFIDEHGKIYVCGANSGLIVFDAAANPANPPFLAHVDLSPWGGYTHDLFVQNNKAYCSSGGDGLFIYDLSNLNSPALLGSITNYPEQGYNHNVWVTADEQYMVWTDETFGTSVKLADISDLSDINVTDLFKSVLEAPLATNSIAHNAFIRDNFVIVSYYDDGVQIFDMTDPSNVQQVAWYDTYTDNTGFYAQRGCWGVYPFFESGNIIASDGKYGLHVMSSSVLNVGIGGVQELAVDVYPTQLFSNQSLNISLNGVSESTVQIRIINSIGQLVANQRHDTVAQISIPIPQLSSGIYIVQVELENQVKKVKINVLN